MSLLARKWLRAQQGEQAFEHAVRQTPDHVLAEVVAGEAIALPIALELLFDRGFPARHPSERAPQERGDLAIRAQLDLGVQREHERRDHESDEMPARRGRVFVERAEQLVLRQVEADL